MRILYVTACMPYGPAETFIIDEIAELLGRNEVLVVPRSPGDLGQHAEWLTSHTIREKLLSWKVIEQALRMCLGKPREVAASVRALLRSRNLKTALSNLAVLPKGLWLAHIAERWGADHIHCHWAGTTATMTMIAGTVSRIPWSFTAHRSDIVSNNLLPEKVRSAAMVRTIAVEGRRMMIARGVDAIEKLTVLPMGVRIPHNTPLPACENVILCPADLLPVKGHRFLIDAWKLLRDRGVKATLWLAGSGELNVALRSQVVKLGLTEVVTFLGTIKHDELLNLYEAGRISAVVLASIDLGGGCHEGIPVALVEAMSYGVPVIATSTGGIPELVQPGTGLLVPPEDSAALARAIETTLRDNAFARSLGARGLQWVAETRDVAYVAAELERLFAAAGSESAVRARKTHSTAWRGARTAIDPK